MANPLLREDVFRNAGVQSGGMTVSGAINKSIFLWILLAASAFYSWTHPAMHGLVVLAMIMGFVLFLIAIFKTHWSPVISPFYALCEGFLLGAISLFFEKSYPGIVFNAILLTLAIFICMLAAYKSSIIRATPIFKKMVFLATASIAVVYIVDLVLAFLLHTPGVSFIHQGGVLGIGFSIFVIITASLNLIIDFDIIEVGARRGAPKYMEWYCSMALMVTLVWLYIEVLRLLTKLRN